MNKIIAVTKKCEYCQKDFIPLSALKRPLGQNSYNWKKRKYCSKRCSSTVTTKGRKSVLGMTWKIENTRNMKGRHPKSEFKKGMTAWNKGKTNWLSDQHKKKISDANKNRTAWNKGKKCPQLAKENNPAWKGGVRNENYLERRKFQRQIQKSVFERDDYTCQMCNVRGGDLQVDHIQPWSEYIELRFDINNCRTLCSKCHYQITFGKPMPPKIRAWGHNLKGGNNL